MENMSEYNLWLQTNRGYTSRTAAVYTSHVRRVLADLSLQAPGTLETWTAEQVEAVVNQGSAHQHANRRSAWNLFTGYMMAEKSISIASARAPSRLDPALPPMPRSTLDALVTMTTRLKVSMPTIERLSWRHLNVHQTGGAYLVDPLQSRTWIALPKEIVDGLREWAQPGDSGNVPLVPSAPGSLTPMPVKMMRAAFQKYVRSL